MRPRLARGARLLLLAIACTVWLSAPAAAAPRATTPAPSRPPGAVEGEALPLVPARMANVAPPGFTSTAAEAIFAAEHSPQMQALHRREHPLFVQAYLWSGRRWWIEFRKAGVPVAEVDVSRAGRVTAVWIGPLAVATYARGHYAPIFDSWYVVVPFTLLFLLPFLDPRRLRSWLTLDGLAISSLMVSYWLFDHAHLEAAVWAVYPPLVYLAARAAAIGLGRARAPRLPSWLTPRTLLAGLLAVTAARVALCFIVPYVRDVGYGSILGAHRIMDGQSLYLASDSSHGDTYGPVAYLSYVPFLKLLPWSGRWDYVLPAHAAALVFDLGTIGGLALLGRRLRRGSSEGIRVGLGMAFAFAANPFTLLAMSGHTNDGLISLLSVLALCAFASPAARGALLGLAAAAKFSPAALLPLFAGPRAGGRNQALRCVAAFTAVVTVAVLAYLPPGGLSAFYDRTIGFQLNRPDVFSPWALHPALDPVKTGLTVAVAVFALALALIPRERTLVQVSALAAAVTIGLQLTAVHWFYFYVVWFLPFLAVALLAGEPHDAEPAPGWLAATPADPEPAVPDQPDRQLVVA